MEKQKSTKLHADIEQIYQFCMSRKEYQEEGFWEIIEYLFMQLIERYQYSLNDLEQVAVVIAPDAMIDDFVDTAREAYYTYLAKQNLQHDDRIEKMTQKWKVIINDQ